MPIADFGHVLEMFADVRVVFVQFAVEHVYRVGGLRAQPRNMLEGINRQVVPAHFIQHHHIERSGGGALIVEAAHMEAAFVRAAVHHAVNDPAIAVEGEDHIHIARE